MMKLFIKNEKGELIEATVDQLVDINLVLFTEDGKEYVRPKPVEASNLNLQNDSMKELAGIIGDMAKSVNSVKDKIDENEAKLAAYQEAVKKGFPLPKIEPGMSVEEGNELFAPYDMAKQGKALMNKFQHPHADMTEEKRKVLAEYFVLFLKASNLRATDKDKEAFETRYGRMADTKTALGDSGNTFPVPDIVESEILAFSREKSRILQYARIWEMTSEKQSWPIETGTTTTAWSNTSGQSDPTISEVELTAEELTSYTAVREMTLADARSDIVSWLTETMGEAAGQELDKQGFTGTGSPCSGLLTAKCGYSVNMGTGSSTFASLSHKELSLAISRLDGMKKEGARWWWNGAVFHYVRIMTDDNNRPIFYENMGAPMSGQVLGYPYSEVPKMTSATGVSTAFINFGNLKYFSVGRRLGATALQVDPYGLFTTNRIRFKIYQRWALAIALPNGFVRIITAAE